MNNKLSPCCKAILYKFASGGSNLYPLIKGAYFECVECHKQYEFNYDNDKIIE